MNEILELKSSINNLEYSFNLVDKETKLPCVIVPIHAKVGFNTLAVYFDLTLEKIINTKLFENNNVFAQTVFCFDKNDFEYSLNNQPYSSPYKIPEYFFNNLISFNFDLKCEIFPVFSFDNFVVIFNHGAYSDSLKAVYKEEGFKFIHKDQLENIERQIYIELLHFNKSLISISYVLNTFRNAKND